MERRPIAGRAAGSPVNDQLVRLLGDLRIQVIHQHPEGGFLMPTFAGNLAASGRANNRKTITHHSDRTVKGVENQSLEMP
jgi:hypothetical protein